MRKPVVGIIGNHYLINDQYPVRAAGVLDCTAVAHVCGATPIILPADPNLIEVAAIMDLCDGVIFTGGRPNVHPSNYGHEETQAHGDFDRARDELALSLITAMIEAGQPILGICRGFQELAVACGCTLHPEIRELEGRMNHRMPPDGTLDEKFELRHTVSFAQDGLLHQMIGAQQVCTNTLHGQGIWDIGDRVVADGWAEDGTIEAIYVKQSKGFAVGTQWHPEWNASQDPVSKALFTAFGKAVADWAAKV